MIAGVAVVFGLPAVVFVLSSVCAPRMSDRGYTVAGALVTIGTLVVLVVGAPVVFGGAA